MSSFHNITINAAASAQVSGMFPFKQGDDIPDAVLANVHPREITAPSIRELSDKPTIQERAKLHPERAVKVVFRFSAILKEQERLEQALETGGYRVQSRVQLFSTYSLADEAVVSDLHEIAMDLGIDDYDIDHEPSFDMTLDEPIIVATVVFDHVSDVESFKHRLKGAGIGTIVENPSFL